jgi:hypothetical protein
MLMFSHNPPSTESKDKTHRRQCIMSSSKKFFLKRDFAAGVYLSNAQNSILPINCKREYSILFTQGRGEGGES